MNFKIKTTDITRVFFIILAIVVVYFNSLWHDFAWDDEYLIKKNPYVKSWNYVPEIFSRHLYDGVAKESNFYRPLQLISLAIDYSAWKHNPFGYHLTNLFLHAANSILVYAISISLSISPAIAFVAAVLFGIAPAISGAVFYIPARADLLMAAFSFLSVLFFAKYIDKKKISSYLFSIASFAAGLLCKEMAIVVPFLLFLIWVFKNDKPRAPKILTPYLLVLSAYALLRLTIFNFAKGHDPFAYFEATNAIPLHNRVLTDFKVIIIYLRFLLFPYGLHIGWFLEPAKKIFEADIVMSAFAIAFLGFIIARLSQKNKFILFGSLWFLIALMPVLNILPVSVLVHDMWLYLPSAGFFIALSIIFMDFIGKKSGRLFGGIVIALFSVYYAFFTIQYGMTWKDSVSILTNTLKYESETPFARFFYNNLGIQYNARGEFGKAVRCYRNSILSAPEFAMPYNNMAIVYFENNRPLRAIKFFKKAIDIKKDYTEAYCNMSLAYNKIGLGGRAVEFLKIAVKIDPDCYKAYCNLGHMYSEAGDADTAIMFFKKAVESNPKHFEPHHCLSELYMKKNDSLNAAYEYEKALRYGLREDMD